MHTEGRGRKEENVQGYKREIKRNEGRKGREWGKVERKERDKVVVRETREDNKEITW